MRQHAISMIQKVFENHDWSFTRDDDDMFFAELELEGTLNNVRYLVLVRDDEFVSYTFFPHNVPASAYGRMAEYLHRANNYLPFCNFEFDYYESEIRIKSYVNFESCKLSYAVVENAMTFPFGLLRAHADSLMRVMYSNEDLETLYLKACETAENF